MFSSLFRFGRFVFLVLNTTVLLSCSSLLNNPTQAISTSPNQNNWENNNLDDLGITEVNDFIIAVDYARVLGDGPQNYGIEYGWIDQDEQLYLERYRRLHLNTIRVQISQQFFEPINDNNDPNFSQIDFGITIPVETSLGKTITFQKMFTTLAKEFPSVHFHINMWLVAKWNASNPNGYMDLGGAFPPLDYGEHREFVRELAHWLTNDCGIDPRNLSFSFINEPNLSGFFIGTQEDLVKLAIETRSALNQVSPLISMTGLDEVHGTNWTDTFYSSHPIGCCDTWTYHVYENGSLRMYQALVNRANQLHAYGPVWVTEFADTANGSPDGEMDFSTQQAALSFAELIGRIWPIGLDGIIHFRLSDTYSDLLEGWTGHGLFADSHGTHADGVSYAIFPSYWVFANMFRELGGGQIVYSEAPSTIAVVAARKVSDAEDRLALWVTNSTSDDYESTIQVSNFSEDMAEVLIYNNLVGDTPINTRTVYGNPLRLSINIPAGISFLFVFKTANAPTIY